MSDRLPFLTGSRVYGTPREDSDFDVVMYVPHGIKDLVTNLIRKEHDFKQHPRVGKLQLILVDSPEEYDAWKLCTEYATSLAAEQGLLSREDSHRIFNDCFTSQDLKDCYEDTLPQTVNEIDSWKQHLRERRNNNG